MRTLNVQFFEEKWTEEYSHVSTNGKA